MRRRVYPERTPKEIEAIRVAYVDTAEPVGELIKRFGLTSWNELYTLIKRGEWPKRGGASQAKIITGQRNKGRRGQYRGAAEWAADQRRAEEERERKMYGGDLKAVRLLQRRGFFVALAQGGYRFERRIITSKTLREIAARESRLTGVT